MEGLEELHHYKADHSADPPSSNHSKIRLNKARASVLVSQAVHDNLVDNVVYNPGKEGHSRRRFSCDQTDGGAGRPIVHNYL